MELGQEGTRDRGVHYSNRRTSTGENIRELKSLTWYWYDREKGEVVGMRQSRKPPREGLALVVTNIYGEIVDMTLEREARRNPAR
jgi:hypothetical protein